MKECDLVLMLGRELGPHAVCTSTIIAAQAQGVHLPTVKVGCQRLNGQAIIEMRYWTQLWSDAVLPETVGRWGADVLKKIPMRM
jgi:hypothetical protein